MKPLLALLFIFSLSHADIQVTELFRAETPEELEAALVDGYPMPWLAEVLADSSIPEEDRYWLDCRMRAVIAQDLHLFFDEEGNEVRIDADWIAPGEDYWRENFMVNGRGAEYLYDRSDQPTDVVSEPGTLVNRFGEEIGQLAMVHRFIRICRDASIGVSISGWHDIYSAFGRVPCFICLLSPNGTYKEVPIGFSGYSNISISNDGSLIAVETEVPEGSDLGEAFTGLVFLLDHEGNVLSRFPMTDGVMNGAPAVSSTGRYVACKQNSIPERGVFLLDGETGQLLYRFGEDIVGHSLSFSQNEQYLCIGGLHRPLVFDCENLEEVWTVSTQELGDHLSLRAGCCSNDGLTIAFSSRQTQPYRFGTIVFAGDCTPHYHTLTRGDIHVSPAGVFTFAQCYDSVEPNSWNDFLCVPVIVNCLEGGE